MGSTTHGGLGRVLGPLRSVRTIPAILERLDALERRADEAERQLDELRTSVAAVGAVRTDVRGLTEHLTEELNRISQTLSADTRG